ncbi:MAG: DUF6526 family protein [Bryobacteraceae bacterium]
MAQTTEQTLSNHTRWDPPYHFVLLPLAIVILGLAVTLVIRHPGLSTLWMLLVSLALILAALKARTYPLKAQDRLIRLEERLRLERLLPEGQRTLIPRLTEAQLVALRFASDAELPALAEAAATKQTPPAEIKKSIQSWRPDFFRV